MRLLLAGMIGILGLAQTSPIVVLGRPLALPTANTAEQWRNTAALIQRALMDRYAKVQNLEATPEEMASLKSKMSGDEYRQLAARLKSDLIRSGFDEPSADQQVQAWQVRHERQQQDFLGGIIQWWKVGRSLYQNYGGGRVRLSAFGTHEPIDAMERFLTEQEQQGNFSVADPGARAAIWTVFLNKNGGDGIASGANASAVYAHPPWEAR